MIQNKEQEFVALSKQELNALSKEIFGTSSKWVKLMDKGVLNPEIKRVVIPNKETGALEQKEFKTGKSTIYRYSLKEVQELMLTIKKNKPAPVADATALEKGDKIKVDGVELEVTSVS